MDVGAVGGMSQVSWKQVAVQKQEVLRTGGDGELVREAIQTIMPTVYTMKDGRITVEQLAPTRRINISV
jgi:hypothetical protein|tara:strand:+ start:2627 stop:2833 length:207 start_codon:yes stop_codon:yes gene_type:complete